jgi:hypothetical protein
VRAALLTLHAGGALVALVVGVALLRAVARHRPPVAFGWYYAGVLVTAVTLVPVVALDWSDLATSTRVAYLALCVLAVVLVVEAETTRRSLRRAGRFLSPARSGRFVDSVGFTVVALLDAFIVVTALGLGASGWAIAVIAVLVVALASPAVAATRQHATRALH